MGPLDRPDRFPDALTVAVVTDDAAWGRDVANHFADIGRHAAVVEGVDELKRQLDRTTVDVILMDQPSDDLWEFCREAQRKSDTTSPVLAVIRPDDDSNEKWVEAGADINFPNEAREPVDVEDYLRAYFSKIPDYER